MEENKEEKDDRIKVILVGEPGVGKTNLINVSAGLKFNEEEKSTLRASFLEKRMNINGQEYKLTLWDTIGQEKLRNLTKIFFKNSKIVIFVYDITSELSFQGLRSWEKDVKELIGDDIIKAVVGNKQDLYLDKEEVKENVAMEYAKSINAKFRLASAKTDPDSFVNFLEELLKDYLNKNEKGENFVKLKPNKDEDIKNKKKKCCA